MRNLSSGNFKRAGNFNPRRGATCRVSTKNGEFRHLRFALLGRHGIALFVVMGLIAVFVPVLMFLSQMTSSQVKQAMKYHESIQAEGASLSGTNSGISRLRGNMTGYQQYEKMMVGDLAYDLTIRPTGTGIFTQKIYYIFSKCLLGKHNYILMADSEQFPPDPIPPVTVISHDFWNTLEPYDINLLADQTSMENFRGQDLLRLEETRNYEKSLNKKNYGDQMLAKDSKLPKGLKEIWPSVVEFLKDEKLTM